MENVYTIDFETTGVDPKTCEPVELALYCPEDDFTWFIKPSIPIPAETSAVHHIIDADVSSADDWATTRNAFAAYLQARTDQKLPILVAHNAEYEKTILLRNPQGCVDFPPVIWICTYKCALRVWPDAPAHKNEVLRYHLKLGTDRGRYAHQQPHSALHDARVTYLLLLELLKHANIEQLVEWSEVPAKLPFMPMGKHYKQTWDTVPGSYLQWCINQADMREDVKFCAKEELDRRKKTNATHRSG
jgi:exodeoxyribonuclease X